MRPSGKSFLENNISDDFSDFVIGADIFHYRLIYRLRQQIMQMISEHFGKGYYEYSTAVGLVYFIVVLALGAVNLIFSKKVYYATQ